MATADRPLASAARLGRSVWIWPIAAAILAAWPVWRSFFAEVPDLGVAPWRAQVAAALGEAVLAGAWTLRYRGRIEGCRLPLLAGAVLVIVLFVALTRGEVLAVDLAALSVCWLAVAFLFAGGVLLDGQRSAAALGGGVPPVRMMLRAQERIGYALLGLALAAATLRGSPQSYALATLAAMSPGAVLIWACLCDTARSILARRRVRVANLDDLPALADHKSIVVAEPAMLVTHRPKLASILPMGETKPAEVVGMAIALYADDDSDLARGLQEFGVAHRLRVPALTLLPGGSREVRRGVLPDRRTVEIAHVEHNLIGEAERAAFAEHLARAAELHRAVLALRLLEPESRLLGLLVLAKAARPGAAEAVKTLRKAGLSIALAATDIDARDREALGALDLDREPGSSAPAIGVVQPGRPALKSTAATIHLGGRPGGSESAVTIARDDPRTLVDLLQFARDFRRRTRIATMAVHAPGAALLAGALGFLAASPLLVSIAALAGFVLAVSMPQALRLSPTLANQVDEE